MTDPSLRRPRALDALALMAVLVLNGSAHPEVRGEIASASFQGRVARPTISASELHIFLSALSRTCDYRGRSSVVSGLAKPVADPTPSCSTEHGLETVFRGSFVVLTALSFQTARVKRPEAAIRLAPGPPCEEVDAPSKGQRETRMSGSQDPGRDGDNDAGFAEHHDIRESTGHPWDLYRRSILKIAEEELPKGVAEALALRLDREVGIVWHDSPSALLAVSVALYRMGMQEEARRELGEAWKIWEDLIEAEDPQTDSPIEILLLLRDLFRSTGMDEGSSMPNHFRMRPVYQWLCQEYERWYVVGEEWTPSAAGGDALQEFCSACLRRANWTTEHLQAPGTLDPDCEDSASS